MDDLFELDADPSPDPLGRDVANVARARSWIGERARLVRERLLVLVPAGPGSGPLLNAALPKLVGDAHALGLRLDVLLGLDGSEPPEVLERLPGTQTVHLWSGAVRGPGEPAQAFASPLRSGAPATLAGFGSAGERTRVHAVHRTGGGGAAGAMPALADLHALVLRSVRDGWPLPARTLRCDAESHFLVGDDLTTPDPRSNGLALLLAELDEGATIASANNLYCSFPDVAQGAASHPELEATVSPVYRCLNVLVGTPGFAVLTGAGFVGTSPEVLATGATVYRTGLAVQVDDVLIQLLARASDFALEAPFRCRVTNRVPPPRERGAVRLQLARWMATGERARRHYGAEYVTLGRAERRQARRLVRNHPRAGRWVGILALLEAARAAWLARRRRDWLTWR